MTFDPEEREQCKDLLEYLINAEFKDRYNEIHIWNDSYCTVVEWETVPYNNEYGGKFEYVEEDQEVMTLLRYPNGDIEWVPKDDADDTFNDWLKEHPGYEKNEWGRWVQKEEING